MIDHQRQFIFIHIPRTGGSSIEVSLKKGLETLQGNNTLGTFLGKHWKSSEYKASKPSEWKSFFKFTFVRNPWDRVISIYEFLKIHEGHPQRTSKEFKEWLFSIKPNCNAYMPQSWYIDEAVDFIGRYETLQEDWAYVLSNVFPSNYQTTPLPHVNKTERHGNYHDLETIDFVSNYYRDDIDSFGYSLKPSI